ncbi:MAG: DNA recombination protein RmuC [Planctomycetota bacterium]
MLGAWWGLIGFVVGVVVGIVVGYWRRQRQLAATTQSAERAQQDQDRMLTAALAVAQNEFARVSREALSANTNDFFKLAAEKFQDQTSSVDQTLDSKKKLIDAKLEELTGKLAGVSQLMQGIERQTVELRGSLSSRLEDQTRVTHQLRETAGKLHEALAHPQRRGQWGERMAEDVLRLAGLIEGINYVKQFSTEAGRPDFTFMLPDAQKVHMDVKFPLANYLKMLDAPDATARSNFADSFTRDVRKRVKEVTDRSYIDRSDGSLDFVLLFIPNEQIYSFIHEHDPDLLDSALRQRVVLCSPLTLYAVLAVIRQAMDNFRIAENSAQVMQWIADFKREWVKYVECMEKMGERLEAASREYHALTTTRFKQLDRRLDQIDRLRPEVVENVSVV